MRRLYLCSCLLFFFLLMPLYAESMDDSAFVPWNTGSVSSLERLHNPDFTAGQTVHVFLSVKDLGVKWGEGQIKWNYQYRSPDGDTIWESPFRPVSERTAESSWDFQQVVQITLPGNIPKGHYALGFVVVDAHTRTEYRTWLDFSIDMGGAQDSAPVDRSEGASVSVKDASYLDGETEAFECMVEGVQLRLEAIQADSNRLTFTFIGTNQKEDDQELRLYSYSARIIDGDGNDYPYKEIGGGGSLSSGIIFPAGVPVKADIYFRRPANTIEQVALLHLGFYSTDDLLKLRSLSVPYSR